MVSKGSTSAVTCDVVKTFLNEVRVQGGNAVIDFRIAYEPAVDPLHSTVVYGTVVVAE